MKLYPVSKMDLVKQTRRGHSQKVYIVLMEFLNSEYDCCRVEDDFYNNNNDLRRTIQSVISINNLPIHVFMNNGSTYIEKGGRII